MKPVVVFIGNNSVIKTRINALFNDYGICFHSVSNSQDLTNVLINYEYQVDLVISDMEYTDGGFNGCNVVSFIKSKASYIPVIVLSSESKKNIITQCLYSGVSEYIIKPFQDDYLRSKVLKYIDMESLSKSTNLNMNLNEFLAGEIYKAKKGGYQFMLLNVRTTIENHDDQKSQYDFYHYSDLVFNSIKELFWEADLYLQNGIQSHIGFFPFCTKSSADIVLKKIQSTFTALQVQEPALNRYNLIINSSFYPEDGSAVSELLQKLKIIKTDA